MQMVTSSSQRKPETFIIQVPKDQIYRVPPPENAQIAERHRKPAKKPSGGKKQRCVFWVLCILLVIALIGSIVFCVYRFTLSPKPPTFSIKHLNATLDHVPGSRKAGFGFRVRVETTNPNSINDIGIQQGNVGFGYKGKMIGKGRFGSVNMGESNRIEEVEVVVIGQGVLPKQLKNVQRPEKFQVDINVTINMKTWLFSKKRLLKMLCQVEVESLGQHSRISSQHCL